MSAEVELRMLEGSEKSLSPRSHRHWPSDVGDTVGIP